MEKTNDYEEEFQTKYPLFCERLAYVMSIRCVTNEKLGELLFSAPSTISGYRTGKRTPSIYVLTQICRKLSVSADYLLGLSDNIDLTL